MAKNSKSPSPKKTILAQIETKLSESLTEFPKKYNGKKYKKIIHKAGKLLSRSIAVKPVKADSVKPAKKTKSKKKDSKIKVQQAS